MVDIACFQKTKWKGSSDIEGNGYKLWYSGFLTGRNGVGVILKACLKDKVIHVNRCSDRIIALTLVIDGETVNMISTYAPQVGLRAVTEGYAGVHGGFGYGVRNEEGRAILDFAIAHDLVVVYLNFKKRDHHLVTFQSGVGAPKLIICWCEEGTSRRVKTVESSHEKHALPNTACSHWTSYLRVFNAGERGVPCRESCGRTSLGMQQRRSDLELLRVFLLE
ncbi:retrovirus-related pol polyprotein LINE-1 [Tanacetum coccineum]